LNNIPYASNIISGLEHRGFPFSPFVLGGLENDLQSRKSGCTSTNNADCFHVQAVIQITIRGSEFNVSLDMTQSSSKIEIRQDDPNAVQSCVALFGESQIIVLVLVLGPVVVSLLLTPIAKPNCS
jgi:hypothetical protein